MWKQYHNNYWPSVYLIDKEGVARWGWSGELGWKGAKGESHMAQELRNCSKSNRGSLLFTQNLTWADSSLLVSAFVVFFTLLVASAISL